MKVLHILESSIPDTGGYTIRARAIVTFQRQLGLQPVVVTSPNFPTKDRSSTVECLDGIRYYRTNTIRSARSARTKVGSYATRAVMLRAYRQAVLDIVERERPEVLHAHSSYLNAYAAMPAASRLGLPLVYEVRTLWGEAAVVEDNLSAWKQRLIWHLELAAMRRADLIIPIAQGIKDALIDRGIDRRKLEIVPNGVDSAEFAVRPRDDTIARQAGLHTRFNIGFIGTLRKLEGLSTLVEAFALCSKSRQGLGLVIVGDGPDRGPLQARARQLQLSNVLFTGNVPHAEVASWYSSLDVLVYPRIRALINERVTPLKPLEAMALGKLCVISDVGGLMELVRDNETGIVFRSGDPRSLAEALLHVMDDADHMERIRRSALDFVRTERDWRSIVPRYRHLYESVAEGRAR